MMNFPDHMYVIQGNLSSLPVFWEAKLGSQIVRQIGEDGMVCHKRSELLLEQLAYWGIVCEQGHFGFDVEQGCVVLNDTKKICDMPKIITSLQYRRSIIVDSTGSERTAWVCFGINNFEIMATFLPEFEIIFQSTADKNAVKQGRYQLVTEELNLGPLNEPNSHGVGQTLQGDKTE